jgi:oxalate decarboxylase/phosphoglucose isomerase-like protein (cupin superfamily)
MMVENLQPACGLPVGFNVKTCELILGESLNNPSYCIRKLHDLDAVWAHPAEEEDRVIYRYTSALHFKEDAAAWTAANVAYGIVIFTPGVFGGEYVKSSGQYHPPISPSNTATPEIYTVLSGVGHFLLQKARPPYDRIEDVVLVQVQAGETFVVPPDYGHLQINPSPQPLVFSYAVRDGMKGQYDPFRARRGAVYYEMANGQARYVFNACYPTQVPLRVLRAADLCQLPELNEKVTYQAIRDRLPELSFLTDPTLFPESARL